MFYLYLNRELIAVSNTFSEIADIFVVECLHIAKEDPSYALACCMFDRCCSDGCEYRNYSSLNPESGCLFEVYYDGKRS